MPLTQYKGRLFNFKAVLLSQGGLYPSPVIRSTSCLSVMLTKLCLWRPYLAVLPRLSSNSRAYITLLTQFLQYWDYELQAQSLCAQPKRDHRQLSSLALDIDVLEQRVGRLNPACETCLLIAAKRQIPQPLVLQISSAPRHYRAYYLTSCLNDNLRLFLR